MRNLRNNWLAIALVLAWPAFAADLNEAKTFDIKPQPMDRALVDFSKQAGFQVVANSSGVERLQTRGVSGSRKVNAALDELLSGSGLSYRVIEPNVIVVEMGGTKAGAPGGASSAGPIVLAQASGSTSSTPVGAQETIVVTSRKREERLIDVPMSVGVVTKEDIDRRGLVHAGDYLRGLPGTNQMDGAPSHAITIRGIEANTQFNGFRGGETTATYFGETPTVGAAGLTGSNIDVKLVDIERVEVLKGPQGTSFGASSMGGMVRVIPAAPRLDRFEGKVGAGYSVTSGYGGDNYNLEAVLNVPVVQDQLALRAVHYQYLDSGYYRNRAASDPFLRPMVATFRVPESFLADADDIGEYSVTGSRLSALWRVTRDLSVTFGYLHQKNETNGIPEATNAPYEQTVLRVAPEDVLRGQQFGAFDAKLEIASATVEYGLGWADLVATYSRVKGKTLFRRPFITQGLNLPLSQVNDTVHTGDIGEVRLATRLDGKWNFLVGAYAEKSDDTYFIDTNWFADPATNTPVRAVLGTILDTRAMDHNAAFGEATWEVAPRWTIAGGVRAFRYEKTNRRDSTFDFGAPPAPSIGEVNDSATTYRASLSYKPIADALLYALFSQGFRVGGAQSGLQSTCDTNGDGIVDGSNVTIASTRKVDADDIDNYELGTKFAGLDRRLVVNAAVYRMNWNGLPVAQVVGNATVGGCNLVGFSVNAGKSRSEGLELQVNFQATRAVRIDAGASYVDARLIENTKDFRAGNRMPGSPRVNANLAIQYDFPIGRYRASVRADAIYVGEFFGDLANSPSLKAGDYTKVDLSARLAINRFNIDFFVKNLLDEDSYTFRGAFVHALGPHYGYQMRPRTIGMQVGYQF
jgi:iron complex outermembrane recepter protein